MASVAADDKASKKTAAPICFGYRDAWRQTSHRLPIFARRVSGSVAIKATTSSVAARPQLPQRSFRNAAFRLLRALRVATSVYFVLTHPPRSDALRRL